MAAGGDLRRRRDGGDKAELSGLGFPGDILNDLTDEDIKACEGASRVFVETNFYSADEGRVVERVKDGVIYNETVYDDNLRITGVAVELDGGRWKIFHHFRWMNDPGACGTESLQLWPATTDSVRRAGPLSET